MKVHVAQARKDVRTDKAIMKIKRERILFPDKDKLKGLMSTKSALPNILERNIHTEEKGEHTPRSQEETKCTTATDAHMRPAQEPDVSKQPYYSH